MEEGDAPRDGGAPIVASEEDFLRAELIGDGENVGSEFGERVVSGATGLAAGVVAALVGDDDAKAGGGERLDLLVPGIPEFGEAMEQDDRRGRLADRPRRRGVRLSRCGRSSLQERLGTVQSLP